MHPKPFPIRDARRAFFRSVAAVALAAAAGCVSSPPPAVVSAAPPPAAPPAPPPPALAPAAILPKPTAPVYRNPKIAMVYLRAHQDADGRLLGPQVMYQVADPGGWNVEAVDQGRAYIPAVNLEIPPGQGSPYVMPARAVPPAPARAALLDPAQAGQIAFTGLMRREDQARAEALAQDKGSGCTAAFDPEAGWILLPGKSPAPEPAATASDQNSSSPPAEDDSPPER